ncbi:hypothetical protein Terro_0090 [Terriglobus roseus DSM 18391]|uniref:VWFA-related domain-containing protein n=1 Tax=Terriglobus roseus (strain DSM 18391 / NRRL B-41598 / KBS 63) TaxID=926566 RepID=I3ZB23_TERRK|nr:hypothetical protein [Terriglobus roseus]AFL86441.1 hypothetical protein Terro_0090 [Terriglobus roseus DSM 18391]
MFTQAPGRPRWLTAFAVAALFCACQALHAQTPPASDHDSDPALFRVYTNLLQIPVLILDPFLQPVKPVDPNKFTIQFDELKPVRPRLVRLQGDDPITLAILIDRTHPNSLLPALADALAALTPGLLSQRDRVVLYETDGCHLRRHGELLPVQRALLQAYAAFAATGSPPNRSMDSCSKNTGLWRSVATVAASLSTQPGRRILLAVTDGIDNDHDYSSEKARNVATITGVAIFSVAERGKVPPGHTLPGSSYIPSGPGSRGSRGFTSIPMQSPASASDLAVMSEFSGGMLLETDAHALPTTLNRFVTLVRGRYIVEFNRPENLGPGQHILNVSIGQPRYFIRPAGTSMPIADPTKLDPSVQHGPLSQRPPDPDQLAPPQITSTTEPAK